jgi:cephalosporin hydroxylase
MAGMFSGINDVSLRSKEYNRFTFQGSPVRTQQLEWEFTQLIGIYERLAPSVILEIGSADGGTLYQWMKRRQPGGIFISIEPDLSDERRKMWTGWADQFGHELHMIGADSSKPATLVQVRSILSERQVDFLFIDGDHSYTGSRSDFDMYGPLVRDGGVIALHDIVVHAGMHAPDGPNPCCVFQTWLDIVEAGYITQALVSQRSQPRCGIGVVYKHMERRLRQL